MTLGILHRWLADVHVGDLALSARTITRLTYVISLNTVRQHPAVRVCTIDSYFARVVLHDRAHNSVIAELPSPTFLSEHRSLSYLDISSLKGTTILKYWHGQTAEQYNSNHVNV
jgi:hypothetical protein